MSSRTARLISRLSLSLAAAATLAACEPAEDNNATNNQPGDMALPDMDADQAPDMDPDMVAAQATLKAASMAGSRLVDVAAPAPITLDLTFEGELPDGAMVEVVFGLPNIHRITVPAAAQLTVTPYADGTYRGPVALSVRMGEVELPIEGGLLYGAGLGDVALIKEGPQVQALPGIERADEVYPLGDGLFMVVQQARPMLAPGALSAEDDTYAVFKLEGSVVKAAGGPVARKRAKHMRTWSSKSADVMGGGPAGVIVQTALDGGGSQLTKLGPVGDALVESAPLATFAASVEVLDVLELGDALYALTAKADGLGKDKLELINATTGKVYGGFEALDARSARLVKSSSIATGVATPIGGVAVAGWRPAGSDAEAVMITHAATDGQQRSVLLHKASPAPSTFAPLEAVATHHEPTVRDEQPLTTLAYTARGGRDLYLGPVKPNAQGDVVFSPVLKPSLIGLEQDGIHTSTYHLKSGGPSTNAMCRLRACISLRAVTTSASGVASGGAHELELAFDGTQVEVGAIGLQSGATPDGAPTLIQRGAGAGGALTLTEVFADKVATYTYDPAREWTVSAEGALQAGARNLARAARLRAGADHVHVLLEATPPSIAQGALRPAIFGVVLALNNTKKEPPALVMPEGESIEFTDQMYVIEAKDGYDDIVFVVDNINKTGERTPALLRVSAEMLKGAESKIVVGQQAGLTLLPKGFVVTQLTGHGDTLFMLGAKSAAGLVKDGRYTGSLFELTAKASGAAPGVPNELTSAAQLAAETGDPAAAFGSITFGDADPATPAPGLVMLLTTAGPRIRPSIRTKEVDRMAPTMTHTLPSGVTIHGGDLIFQDSSAFLLGFDGGDATKPVAITFSVAGMAPEVKPLRLIGQLQGELIGGSRDLDSDNDASFDLVERVAQSDLNGDGALDLLVASSADPQRRSYELLLLGQPGGGFTPIFGPDATIYGAAPITQQRTRGSVIGPAMASKLKK